MKSPHLIFNCLGPEVNTFPSTYIPLWVPVTCPHQDARSGTCKHSSWLGICFPTTALGHGRGTQLFGGQLAASATCCRKLNCSLQLQYLHRIEWRQSQRWTLLASLTRTVAIFSALVDLPASNFTLFHPHLHFPLIIQLPFRVTVLNSNLPHLNHINGSPVLLGWSVHSSAWHQRPTKVWLQPTPPISSPAIPSLTLCSKLPAVPQSIRQLHAFKLVHMPCLYLKCPLPFSQGALMLFFKIQFNSLFLCKSTSPTLPHYS